MFLKIWTKFRPCLLIFVATISYSSWCAAQSWSDLAQDFVEYSPDLAQLKAESQKNKYKVYEGYSMVVPSLTYNFLGTYQDRPAPNESFGAFSDVIFPPEAFRNELEANWAVYAGGRILGTLKLNKLAEKSSNLVYRQAKNEGLFRLFQLTVQINDAQQQLRILKISQDTQQTYLNLVLKKEKSGNVSPYEVNQARADFYSYLPRIINLQSVLTNLQADAKKLLGQSLQVNEQMFAVKPNSQMETMDSLLKEALEKRHDLLINTIQSERVDINRNLLFSSHRPEVLLSAALGYQTQDFDDIWDSSFLGHAVNLNFRWKIFEGGALFSRLKISALERVNFEKNRQALLDSIKADIFKNFEMGKTLVRLLSETQKWQAQTELALKKGQKSYQIGKVTQLEWLQLQKADEAARLALVNVSTQWLTHEIERQFLLGRDLMAWAKRQ